jgi:hypothetical protein
MLRHRHELDLSSQQAQDLENLRDEYQRAAIRAEADLRIAELDLQSLLKADPVDLAGRLNCVVGCPYFVPGDTNVFAGPIGGQIDHHPKGRRKSEWKL